jgi:mono/diheme cytochrome c family protein
MRATVCIPMRWFIKVVSLAYASGPAWFQVRGSVLLTAVMFAALGLPARAGYKIENVAYPKEISSRHAAGIAAVTFTPRGSMFIATRFGEIWMQRLDGSWQLFARGLDDPLGLVADSETIVYIAHRPELMRAVDIDNDGHADTFEVVGGDWGQTLNYHEFVYGLKRDRAGNFYLAPSLESTGSPGPEQKAIYPTLPVRGPRNLVNVLSPTGHRSDVAWRGWMVRITPNGETEPLAAGFRQPNGIGLSPDDDLFVTDNQGEYKPATGLIHVQKGDFHGHAASLKWEPGFNPANISTQKLWERLKTPAVVFPYGALGVSPGEPVWDVTGGKFGPYQGQVFVGDYSRIVIRASIEKVAGAWQGAAFPFLGRSETPAYVTGDRLKSGTTRCAFSPDGSLYLAATSGQGAGEDGLQRVTWDGMAMPDILNIQLTDHGFKFTFTSRMSVESITKAENYEINRFRYLYHANYGSPRVDEARVHVKSVRPSNDAFSAEVTIEDLQPGFIYEASMPGLRTVNERALANPLGYYTVNRLHNNQTTIGGTTRLPQSEEAGSSSRDKGPQTQASLIAAGEQVYRLYCVACHQPDGRGVIGGAANFVDDKTRLAKPDAELLAVISNGIETKGMPAFGSILTAVQRKSALEYVRSKFSPLATAAPK